MIHFDTDSILEYFVQRLKEKLPTKADKILNALKRERDGNLRHRFYKERDKGKTEQWQMASRLFELHFRRLGFERVEHVEKTVEVAEPIQQKLF